MNHQPEGNSTEQLGGGARPCGASLDSIGTSKCRRTLVQKARCSPCWRHCRRSCPPRYCANCWWIVGWPNVCQRLTPAAFADVCQVPVSGLRPAAIHAAKSASRSPKCACGMRRLRIRGDGEYQGVTSAAHGPDHAAIEVRFRSVARDTAGVRLHRTAARFPGAHVQVSSRCWPRRHHCQGWHPFVASLAFQRKRCDDKQEERLCRTVAPPEILSASKTFKGGTSTCGTWPPCPRVSSGVAGHSIPFSARTARCWATCPMTASNSSRRRLLWSGRQNKCG